MAASSNSKASAFKEPVMHMNFQNIHDLVYLNILSFSWDFLCLFLASFKEVIFILVSEDYLDVV